MALAMVVLGALNPGGIFLWIILGLLAGFLATRVVRGPHFGIIGDIVIGLVGAFLYDFGVRRFLRQLKADSHQ